MNLHQQKKNIEKEDKPKQAALPAGDTNVFIGSTTDLQRMLKDINEKEVKADYDTIEDSRHDEG